MKKGKEIILMYSRLKIYCNIKIYDYAEVNAIEITPTTFGSLTK